MTSPKLVLLICMAAVLAPGLRCETKVSDDTQRARLPEFLTELDLASLEASAEDVESLKKIVKRLAPAKNGEYLMYQVFFGNEDLLKEWLKGAGVMGQPGVDFPVLTTIPATKFSCRGLKGGYYADLETNCQVFHICDNGRKISFLCPNGTVFQQSQLICDWWFKVDCGKSADLYEQSAEQLAEEERKRADAKKMNSEFHRASNVAGQKQFNYQSQNQNVDYDGRQNGRTNPFGQTTGQSQTNPNNLHEQTKENNQQLNGRNGNQFGQEQVTVAPQAGRGGQYNQNQNQNYNNKQQQHEVANGNSQQASLNRQNFNNYNARQHQTANKNSNSAHDDYKLNNRSPKGFSNFENSLNEPTTSTVSPYKEYQQPAESAAFATSRNNRYNKSFQYNQFGSNFYSSNQLSGTNNNNGQEKGSQNPFGAVIGSNVRQNNQTAPQFFTPIYKPRSTSTTPAETTTQKTYVNTDIYRQNSATQIPELTTLETRFDYRENSQSNAQEAASFPSTQKPYVNTDTYRHGAAGTTEAATTSWTSYDQTTASTTQGTDNFSGYSTLTTESYEGNTVTGSPTAFYTEGNSQGWGMRSGVTQNSVDEAESDPERKPFSEEGNAYREIVVTSRNLSPYDTSVTYKNGKIASSTLGPYVPFTKNYAYATTTTTTTTNKPPVYTATVPTIPDNRKLNVASTAATPWFDRTEAPKVSARPLAEQEHAIEMLHSLQELETTPPTSRNGSRIGLNIPPSSGPATLHTLALYFATAGENFSSNESATDTAVRIKQNDDEKREEEEEQDEDQPTTVATEITTTPAELPTSLLTRNTVKSYSDLFSLNSALQPANNVTTSTRLTSDDGGEDYYSSSSVNDDAENDLDIQQSQGPVSGTNKRGNNPKLRELAQVFTHALSAYLQDPDTFRKVLTEIRPTEPPTTTNSELTEATTTFPTTQEDYPSATKEKDEVLDFSDVTKANRRKKLTTPYPAVATTQTFTTPFQTTYENLYTTQEATSSPSEIDESLNEAQSSDFRSSDDATRNDFAREVNHVLRDGGSNDVKSYDEVELTAPSGPNGPNEQNDSYFPIGPVFSGNRFGGFQNNSAFTHQPYGKGVRPTDATPIGDNYTPESTPAFYSDTAIKENEFGNYEGSLDNFVTPGSFDDLPNFTSEDISGATTGESVNRDKTSLPSTRQPFIINYFDTATKASRLEDDNPVTSNYEDNFWPKEIDSTTGTTTTDYPETLSTRSGGDEATTSGKNTHWTASPDVTKLWETTVFLDPNRINQGLTGPSEDVASTVNEDSTTPISRQETSATDFTDSGITTNTPSWKWTPSEEDSPTAFTLLPTVYATENTATATPAPTYTTHSSIVTTITSTVSSTTKEIPSVRSVEAYNITENEIVKAQEIFGGLNATSSNTLMRVMKQADRNSTVRQLVLLLISHCKGPMNKTMEEEKEELLNALLRMPVNEFSTEESRDIIAGINNLELPIGRSVEKVTSAPATVTTAAAATTFRSRRGRKFRTSSDGPKSSGRSGDADNTGTANSLSIEAESPSDNRALELLKSLYTIAAKWG